MEVLNNLSASLLEGYVNYRWQPKRLQILGICTQAELQFRLAKGTLIKNISKLNKVLLSSLFLFCLLSDMF
jgi:hypothetical protein